MVDEPRWNEGVRLWYDKGRALLCFHQDPWTGEQLSDAAIRCWYDWDKPARDGERVPLARIID